MASAVVPSLMETLPLAVVMRVMAAMALGAADRSMAPVVVAVSAAVVSLPVEVSPIVAAVRVTALVAASSGPVMLRAVAPSLRVKSPPLV